MDYEGRPRVTISTPQTLPYNGNVVVFMEYHKITPNCWISGETGDVVDGRHIPSINLNAGGISAVNLEGPILQAGSSAISFTSSKCSCLEPNAVRVISGSMECAIELGLHSNENVTIQVSR
jgi:hypothetical protein